MNRKAFTLIELLVAGMILVITASGFCASLQQFNRYFDRIEKERASLTLAANKMEELRAIPFASLPSYNGASLEGGTIMVSTVAADLLRIEVNGLVTLRSKYQ